jgi:hypothetical protein
MWGAVGSTAAPDPPTKGCAGRLPAWPGRFAQTGGFTARGCPRIHPHPPTRHPARRPTRQPRPTPRSPRQRLPRPRPRRIRRGHLDWIADHFTDEAARTLVSLVERARNAAILKSWAEAKTYNPAPAVGRAQVPDDDEPIQPWLEGESAFGIPNPYGRQQRPRIRPMSTKAADRPGRAGRPRPTTRCRDRRPRLETAMTTTKRRLAVVAAVALIATGTGLGHGRGRRRRLHRGLAALGHARRPPPTSFTPNPARSR